MIYEKAYAKINLALEVGKEENGYHKVQNLMIPINLFDELFFQKSKNVRVDCDILIEDNLCLKAVRLFKEKFAITEGVTITLNKKIPIMAGLAGGSSDAAATLRGLNRLFDTKASQEDLYEIACQLGSDVPFFLQSKAALCTGRGEIIRPLDFDISSIPFLLIKPSFGSSTKEVYARHVYDGISKQVTLDKLMKALKEGNIEQIDQYAFNDLEKTILASNENLRKIYDRIEGLSYHLHISGSGPSMYILDAKTIDLENVKALGETVELFLCHTL